MHRMLKGFGLVAAIIAVIAIVPTGSAWAQTGTEQPVASGSLSMKYVNNGFHKATQWNPQKYPFNYDNTGSFSQADFSKMLGGMSFTQGADVKMDAGTVTKLLAGFCKTGTVTGSLTGKVESVSGSKVTIKVSGNVKCHWEEGGQGKKDVDAALTGTITVDSKKVTEVNITGAAKASGSWNYGSGSMELEGEATVSLSGK